MNEDDTFMVPQCDSCKIIVWPPSNFCSNCLGDITWKKAPRIGRILEFSKQDKVYFCLVEMKDSFCIIGKVTLGIPKVGQSIKLEKYRQNDSYFEMTLL